MELGLDAGRLEEKTQGISVAEALSECKRMVREGLTFIASYLSFDLK